MAAISIASNPFTPRSGQEPKVFIGRDHETSTFLKHLNNTKHKRFDHFVVLGSWGTGKTTLLKEFKKTAQSRRVLTSFVSVHEFSEGDILAPVIQLLTHIPRNLPIKFERLKKFSKYLDGIGITFPVVGGGIEVGERNRFKGDPQVLLLDGLIRLWQELKEQTDALIVFLDDVQNYDAVRQVLGILKNVLSDDEIISKTGYLFILAATEEGWAGFLRKNDPIGRYFIPMLKVRSLAKQDTYSIIDATLAKTGVVFTDDVKEAVYEYTNGHPYQLQIFCSYLYENQIKGKVTSEQLDVALSQTLEELGPIVLEPLYSAASEQEKKLLQVLSKEYRIYEFDDILKQVTKERTRISRGAIGPIITRLSDKKLLLKTERGKYRIANRLLHEFICRQ
jgi:AAA+ ATPase superfamily predicted ATPase